MEIKANRKVIFTERTGDYSSSKSWIKNLVAAIFHFIMVNIGSKHFNEIKSTKGNFLPRFFKNKAALKNQSYDNGINLFI